jgi:hypothetical protein
LQAFELFGHWEVLVGTARKVGAPEPRGQADGVARSPIAQGQCPQRRQVGPQAPYACISSTVLSNSPGSTCLGSRERTAVASPRALLG